MIDTSSDTCPIHLIASSKNWIEGEATRQLEQAARLPGMCRVVGLPDLHPGRGFPIGAALLSREVIYPFLIGNDIGCGMALWQTDIKLRKLNPDRLAERIEGLENPWDGDLEPLLERHGLEPSWHDEALGTLGGSNHFAELQAVEQIVDAEAARQAGLDPERCVLLVHSGSRSLGEEIFSLMAERLGKGNLAPGEDGFAGYLEAHEHACRWARANRELIARRFMEQARTEGSCLLDLCHNSLTPRMVGRVKHWLHRKGAAPADGGLSVVAGTRGTLSYLVAPVNPSMESGWSLPHGAGRKWNRSQCQGRLDRRYSPGELRRTPLGSRVICGDFGLLYEEAPQAYKNIEVVVQDAVEAGLARVVATLRPLISYKTRSERR